MPTSVVVPELYYPDLDAAVAWLAAAFGFHERLRVAGHRAQLCNGGGDVVAVQSDPPHPDGVNGTHAVMVRVADVDAHYRRAVNAGAHIASPPADYAYGERQYLAVDPGGHLWTFSQTLADHAPADWGGIAAGAPGTPAPARGDTADSVLPCPGD
ncbi:VOC family protein [Rhodanobacter geophilus]|uniref:VOC family protein n=1 Tax=Rhodanobacter geophilus TaxID=3162488 RepID=A0ABV3QKJ3_9GAMM